MPPTMPSNSSSPALLAALRGLRLKVKAFSVLYGLGLVLATTVGALLAIVLMDYFFNMPVAPRIFFIVLTLAAMVYILWTHVARPLFSRLSLSDVAGHLETAFPHFEDRLRSTVDFIRPEVPGSPIMKRFVVQQADELAAQVDLGQALHRRPVVYSLLAGLAAVVLAGTLAVAFTDYARIAISRLMIVHAQAWPKRVQIDLVGTIPDKITEGDSIALKMRLAKGDYDRMRAYVHVRYDSGAEERKQMTRDEQGNFTANVVAKGTAMTVWMTAGDDATREQAIVVVEPLEVRSVDVTVAPPPYAKIDPTTYKLGRAPLAVTAGSVVTLNIGFNKPLASDRAVVLEPSGGTRLPSQLNMLARSNASEQKISWALTESLRFKIRGTDTDHFQNSGSDEYMLSVREDQLPTVEITAPAGDDERTSEAMVNLEAVARDDFGITSMTLMVDRLADKKHWEIPLNDNFKLTDSSNDKRSYLAKYKWELAQLEGASLKAGDVLQYAVRVTDNYEYNGAKHAPVLSNVRKITIISQDTLSQQVTEALQKTSDKVRAVQNSQNRTKEETAGLRKDVENKAQPDITDRTGMLRLSDQQSMIAAQTKRIAEAVEDAAKRLEENRSKDDRLKDIAKNVKTTLNEAAENPMTDAQRKLNEAAQNSDPQNAKNNPNASKNRNDALENSEAKQQEASAQLGKALEQMQDLHQLETAIAKIREALDKQREASKALTEVGKEAIGKKREELTPEQQKKLDEIAKDQQKQADNTERLTNDLNKSAQQTEKSDPSASEAMKAAAKQSQQQQVASNQAQAAQNAQQNQQASAQARQQQAELGLQMMLDSLREAQRRKLEQLARELSKLQDLIDGLIRRQAGHNIDNLRIQGGEAQLKQITEELLDHANRAKDAQPAEPTREQLTRSQAQTEGNTRDVAKTAESVAKGGAEISATLGRAATNMERATVQLKGGTLPEAYDPNQVKALLALLDAKQKTDKAAAEVQEEAEEANRETIRQAYEKIKAEQELVNKETARIDSAQRLPDGSLRREDAIALRGLPDQQGKLADRTKKLEESLVSLGSIVFIWANKDIVTSMDGVKGDLAKPTTAKPTQVEQQRIIEQLNVMIASLATKPKQSDFNNPPGGGGGGGQPPKSKMPTEAELRLLKGLQVAVNKATRILNGEPNPDKPKVVALGGRQGDLRNLLDQLLKKASEGKIKLDPEPDPKKRLPEESSTADIENQEFDEWLRGGKPGDDQLENDIKMAGQRMARSRQRLALDSDPGKTTQAIQERILMNLDHLIQMAREQQAQARANPNSRRQRGQQAQPNQGNLAQQNTGDSQNRGTSPATVERGGGQANNTADPSADIRGSDEEWGKLTPRERAAMLDGIHDRTIAKYRQLIDDYYEMMSKKASRAE